jgi:hypothetical protein
LFSDQFPEVTFFHEMSIETNKGTISAIEHDSLFIMPFSTFEKSGFGGSALISPWFQKLLFPSLGNSPNP